MNYAGRVDPAKETVMNYAGRVDPAKKAVVNYAGRVDPAKKAVRNFQEQAGIFAARLIPKRDRFGIEKISLVAPGKSPESIGARGRNKEPE